MLTKHFIHIIVTLFLALILLQCRNVTDHELSNRSSDSIEISDMYYDSSDYKQMYLLRALSDTLLRSMEAKLRTIKDTLESLQYAKKLIKYDSMNYLGYFHLAQYYENSDKFDSAIFYLNKLVTHTVFDLSGHYLWMSRMYEKIGNDSLAYDAIENEISYDTYWGGNRPNPWEYKFSWLFKRGLYSKALTTLDEFSKAGSRGDPPIGIISGYKMLIIASSELTEREFARDMSSLNLSDDYQWMVPISTALFYANKNDFEKAFSIMNKIELRNNYYSFHMGFIYFKSGNKIEACKQWKNINHLEKEFVFLLGNFSLYCD